MKLAPTSRSPASTATKRTTAEENDVSPTIPFHSEFLDRHLETLWPGLDFKSGTTYMTLPALREVEKKDKDGETYDAVETVATCITSKKERFLYNEATLYERGFQFPNTFVLDTEERWATSDVVSFLSGRTSPPDPVRLFMRIRRVFETYIEFDDDRHYDLAALFIMFTYVFRVFPVTGYIHFHGTAQSGKSQNLSILRALAFNCVWSSSMTPAAMFRQVSGNPGTLCIDEAESFDSEKGSELRTILLGGYKAGNLAQRVEKGRDGFMVKGYQTYGPKVMASIAPIDPTLGSRTLIIPMKPATRRLSTFQLDSPEWSDLRNQLYLWAMYHTGAVDASRKVWERDKRNTVELYNRQWEVASQFIILADYISSSGLTAAIIESFYRYYRQQAEANEVLDKPRMVLKLLPRVIASVNPYSNHYYSLQNILDTIKDYTDEDQREWQKSRGIQKILDVLGFDKKMTAKGGMHIQIHEDDVRSAILRRKVNVFEEDIEWMNNEINFQTPIQLPPEPVMLWGT